jgi:hypothetical protein
VRKRVLTAVLGALAVAFLICGCGGGEDDSSGDGSSSSALTKAEFIKRGDEICRKSGEAIFAEATEFAKRSGINAEQPSEAQQEEVYSQVVGPALKRQSEEIADLGPPEGEEEAVEAIVAALSRGAEEIEEDPKAALSGKNPLEEASKLAAAFGFKRCGNTG